LVASALVWQFGLISQYSRGVTLLFLVAFWGSLLGSRPLVRLYLKRLAACGAIEQRIAFYGADAPSLELISDVLAAVRLPHLRFVGVADDRPKVNGTAGFPFIGGCAELATLARRGEVDQILIAVPNLPRTRLHEIVDALSEVSIDVSLIPAEAIELAPDYRVRLLGTLPVLNLWQRPFRDINGLVKRAEDIVLGGAALLFLSPLIAVTALLVRFTSAGPILFVQPRVGFNNELIRVFKFRTMYAHETDVHARSTTVKDDPRVTAVGRILRRLSIDELPQLFNVLRGEMSLVGPRPHALEMKVGDRYYRDAVRGYAGRHRVRPGITGLAQVRGLRGEIRTLERAKQRVEFDKQYIDSWSLGLDLRILAATARAVFFDRDAY
jgi:Undecaprenyl-phosphate glucose phosphotransferase